MSEWSQFWGYAHRVFGLERQLRGIQDDRQGGQVPTAVVSLALFLGALLRWPSHLAIAHRTEPKRYQRFLGWPRRLDHETLAYVSARYRIAEWRQVLVDVVKRLKRNKALERCKIHGALWLSLDANEHFASRARCCDTCCRRRVRVQNAAGQAEEVTEFYHRYVVGQINGPGLNLVLDLAPLRPGEEECAAALRLLGRVRRLYGPRFFDGVTVDAWYARGSFLRAVRRLGWGVVVVLKQERYEVVQEARQLGQLADQWATGAEQVKLYETRDLRFSDGYDGRVRVVRAEETTQRREQRGGRRRAVVEEREWLWAATEEWDGYPAKLVWAAGHRRWGIENKAFNELTQHYHLTHCYHHHPVAMLAQWLILLLAFNVFNAFALLHSRAGRGGRSLAALTQDLVEGLAAWAAVQEYLDSG